MRIAVIIPDRGDRPQFLENCKRMMSAQTLQPSQVFVAGGKPINDKCDITFRYRKAYNIVSAVNCYDLIAFIENDDWYAPDYLEYMVREWEKNKRPDLFGTNYTIYYNLRWKKYFKFQHINRSSACNTFIKPGLTFTWPSDHDPYLDNWLWISSGITSKLSIEPAYIISVGIKHGIGKIGGEFHTDHERRFVNEDAGFLKNTLDPESFDFYNSIVTFD